ncbi:MAG TPA: xanthine dehydrogenase family protein molybdopterin-binding subunit [Candidatus Tumulicola sp.]|nr:xanthine dehydrogenase family protein molybdopterin-binding subunit [Candidatus Tumulicola sp.]
MAAIIGTRRIRPDAADKATGRTVYTADVALEGALAGVVVRSPHAFARVVKVDVARAQALPGVRAVAHAGNTPSKALDFGIKDQYLFPRPYARYVGEPVAAVAADTEAQARAAAAAIQVEYEVLAPVLDARAALKPDAPLVHPDWEHYEKTAGRVLRRNVCGYNRVRRGDVDAAFKSADRVVESEFHFSPGMPGYLEPRAAAARPEPDGGLTLWCGSQSPYSNRDELAAFFDLVPERVRFVNQFVGGAFGGKILMAAEWFAAALALQSGKPVRVLWSRHEDGLHIFPRHGGYAKFASAVKSDGTLLAMRASFVYDTGAYIGYGGGTALISSMLASAPYRIPNLDIEATLVYTNKHIAGPVRAPGGPQANFAKESHLEEVARALGMDSLEFRLKNAWNESDVSPTGQKLEGVTIRETLGRAAKAIGWGEPLPPNHGRGIACTWWFSSCAESKARVEIRADGSVLVASGNAEVGTGSAASALPMIAADALGIDPQKITLLLADTASATYDSGVGGSGSTFSAGLAVRAAAKSAREQLLARAEDALEARADDIELRDGRASVRGAPEHGVSFEQLAKAAGGSITGSGEAESISDPEHDETLTETHGFASWLAPSYTTTAAEVEVDPETGRVAVRKITTVQDVGFAVNPAGAIGQIEGGAVQGLGFALTEELVYDGHGDLMPDFKDYLLPTSVDAPAIEAILLTSKSGAGPFGMKGVGEPPVTTPAGAIANAIRDAVGVAPHETPMTPERVWRALQAK